MTINDIIKELEPYNLFLLAGFIIIPVLSFLYGMVAKGDKAVETGHRYVYAALVYLASVPGMLSGVLTAYILFIERSSLLEVNVLVYFVPIVSMVSTIFILKRNVDLNRVPGFDRLYGLFIVLAVTFTISLAIIKTRIWLFFGSSMLTLLIISILLFAFLQVGMNKLFKPRPKTTHKPGD